MKRQIHIHLPAPKQPCALLRPKVVTKDSSDLEQDYAKWCKSKGLDPRDRVTFKKYVREKNLNPNMESLLEKSARIGTADAEIEEKGMSDRRKRLITALKKHGFNEAAASVEAKKYMSIPDMAKLERGLEAKGFTLDSTKDAVTAGQLLEGAPDSQVVRSKLIFKAIAAGDWSDAAFYLENAIREESGSPWASKAKQLLDQIKSRSTKDESPSDLAEKRKRLEEEFDKADDSGDNRAMDRIRKELAALDKQIEAAKKKEKGTADAGLGKLIKTLTSDRTMVKVYFDAEWEEYIARLYYKFAQGWVEKTEASYHTDDKEDALSTASDMFRRAESRTKDAEFSTFPSLYKTARDPKSGSVYKVIGQNNKSKEASTHLLLKMPHGNSWWEVNKVEPVL